MTSAILLSWLLIAAVSSLTTYLLTRDAQHPLVARPDRAARRRVRRGVPQTVTLHRHNAVEWRANQWRGE